MQWSLFVLILMGQCAFFTCHLYEYHFINKNKTWTEAQRYCRENHTDLATVTNKADTERLCDCAKNEGGAWIGLHNEPEIDNRKWHWSQPELEFKDSKTNWAPGEPNDSTFPGNCVRLRHSPKYKWADETCLEPLKFVCYDDKNPEAGRKFHFIDDKKSWPEAQSHCRDTHTDLVSGLDQLEHDDFKAERRQNENEDLWIGLFRDTWRWSDGSNSSFRHSGLELSSDGKGRKKCAVIVGGTWSSEECNESKPFVCSDAQCEYHFINETKTWTEAQRYCREHHTDLATVTNMTDMNRLRNVTEGQEGAWIGLHNQPGKDSRVWHWSLPGVEFNKSETDWAQGEPNNHDGAENCVEMRNGKLNDRSCAEKNVFICYDETNKMSHLINETMTWPEAQRYCRENHTDLISGHKQLDEYNKTFGQPRGNVWIGLFRDTWRWSDQSSFSFRNWNPEFLNTAKATRGQACVVTKNDGTWETGSCDVRKPFFCYEDHVILIKQNMTWVDALYYCREQHRDLVSITSHDEQMWVQEKAKQANSAYVWLGLRYTCTLDFWFWVSDEVVHYKNWKSPVKTDGCDMSGAMESRGAHEWVKRTDEKKFNFICFK